MSDELNPSFSVPFTGTPGSQGRHQASFPDPYLDYSSTQMPRTITDVIKWSEYVYLTYGVYRTAVQRVVRYFLTPIELTDADDSEKEKYDEFLRGQLKVYQVLANAGDDFMVYGNSFTSLHVPFRRYLKCPECGLIRPIRDVKYKFQTYQFIAKCESPKCTFKGAMERIDRQTTGQDDIKIIRWSPHEIKIHFHPVSRRSIYYWDIPAWFRNQIKNGIEFYVNDTPWEIVEAIKAGKMLRFAENVVYHFKEEGPAGVWSGGWGVPRIFGNFKQAWYNQILRRYNEAIALDYIVPFRVITPQAGTSREADPLLHANLAGFQNQVFSMIRDHRRDPTTIHALPFPVKMDMMGADARTLAPVDLLNQGTDDLLNAQGVPVEFYRGTFQLQTMPAILRLFEMSWGHLTEGLNGLLDWICEQTSNLLNWEDLHAKLQTPTMAYDLERKQLLLQLAAGQQISRQTAWSPFGLNVREEIKRTLQEEGYVQEEMANFQEDQAQKQELQQNMATGAAGMLQSLQGAGQPGAAMAPGAPAGGAPAPGQGSSGFIAPAPAMGNSGGVTPEDLTAQAEQIAQQMLAMPYEIRRSQLLQLKKGNETLHSLVIAKMGSIRQQAQTIGGQQVLQQQAASGGAPPM
jgi:hypothetical protein